MSSLVNYIATRCRSSAGSSSLIISRFAIPIVATGILLDKESSPLPSVLLKTVHTKAEEAKKSNGDDDDDDHGNGNETSSKKKTARTFFDITEEWDEKFEENGFLRRLVQSEKESEKPTTTTTMRESGKTNKSNGVDSSRINPFMVRIGEVVSSVLEDGKNVYDKNKPSPTEPQAADGDPYENMGKTLLKLITSSGETSAVDEIIKQAKNMEGQGDVADKVGLTDVAEIAQKAVLKLEEQIGDFLGDEHLPAIVPSQLFFYLENQEEVKNPSHKRRKHRFYPGVDIKRVEDLNRKLRLGLLSYADTLDEIQQVLETNFNSELAFCAMESLPGKPSHFIAVKKDQSYWSNYLEVTLVVRGTKTITDVITDLLCEASPYRGGYAHDGILESGQYLVKKHHNLLKKLCNLAGKKKVKLTLVGHSLGAGAASIAGIEFNDNDMYEVEVFGFGCPALLSKDLSEKTKRFITTIVADDDCIPRMSTATMVNSVLDIGSFDWIDYARRDVEDTVDQVKSSLPWLLTDGNKRNIMSIVDELLPSRSSVPERSDKVMQPVLFPPGTCVHFYRDGFGVSGNYVPCTFFGELNFSRRMVHDHLIYTGYELIFLDLMRQFHEDHHFRFDIDKIQTGE